MINRHTICTLVIGTMLGGIAHWWLTTEDWVFASHGHFILNKRTGEVRYQGNSFEPSEETSRVLHYAPLLFILAAAIVSATLVGWIIHDKQQKISKEPPIIQRHPSAHA